jgi:hypothetical protein
MPNGLVWPREVADQIAAKLTAGLDPVDSKGTVRPVYGVLPSDSPKTATTQSVSHHGHHHHHHHHHHPTVPYY